MSKVTLGFVLWYPSAQMVISGKRGNAPETLMGVGSAVPLVELLPPPQANGRVGNSKLMAEIMRIFMCFSCNRVIRNKSLGMGISMWIEVQSMWIEA
jgi:hypothetical protein